MSDVMPIYTDIKTNISGRQMILKTAYWHDTEEFTLLRGSYCNDTGEHLSMLTLDIISKCHEALIRETIKETLKKAA